MLRRPFVVSLRPIGFRIPHTALSTLRTSTAIVAIAALLLASASLLPGCAPAGPVIEKALDPWIVKSWPVSYWVASHRASTAISPDGVYMLLVQAGPEKRVVTAIPLAPEDSDEIRLYEVDNAYLEKSSLDLEVIGWISETECAFLAAGSQFTGPNEGRYGISLLTADIETGRCEETAFIPLSEEHLQGFTYLPESGQLSLEVTGAVWSFDLRDKSKGKTARLVKDGLPTYSLFPASVSPDASAYIYEDHEVGGENGLYMLDTSTGNLTPFALNGDTVDFYASWSPDGQYVATYSVARFPEKTGTTWMKYAVYPGGDGPMPVATHIVVRDRAGRTINTISLDGRVLANFRWSPDSKSIAFAVAPKPDNNVDAEVDWVIPELLWDSIYVARALEPGEPSKVAGIVTDWPQNALYVFPIAFDPESKGVYYQVSEVTGQSEIWYAPLGETTVQPEGGKPLKVAGGYWMPDADAPSYGNSLAALIGYPSGKTELWLLSSQGAAKVEEWPGNYTMVIAFSEDTLVTCEIAGESKNKITVRSMYTNKDISG